MNFRRRTLSLLLSLVIAFVFMPALAFAEDGTEEATEKVSYTFSTPRTLYKNRYFSEEWALYATRTGEDDFIHVTYAKSSNPKVLKVKKDYDGLYNLVPKKSGKVTITATFKDPETGSKQTIKRVFYVRKYPVFIKSLRLNGKKMNLKTDVNSSSLTTKKTSVRVQFALKNGWKKTNAVGYYYKKNGKKVEIPKKEIAKMMKGKKFKFPKKYKSMYVSVGLQKGEDYLSYFVEFER